MNSSSSTSPTLDLETLKQRATPWLQPISAQAPGGQPAKSNPAYESVLFEMDKLHSLTGAYPDWLRVIDQANTVLTQQSKDLLLACYLAAALAETDQVSGATTGFLIVSELMNNFWLSLFPEPHRAKARLNAISWFVERMGRVLARETLANLSEENASMLFIAASRLGEVIRAKFEDKGPALQPLLQQVARMKPAPAVTPPAAAPTPVPVSAPSVPAIAPLPLPERAGEDSAEYLRGVGKNLIDLAVMLRKARPTNPEAYRLIRTGAWIHLSLPPVAKPPPPPASMRAQWSRLSANAKWEELLEETESAILQYRFWIDPHRYSALALAALGPSFDGAKAAVTLELAGFLKRFPSVLDGTFSDQSPFADNDSRVWCRQMTAHGSASATASDTASQNRAKATELLAQGKISVALGCLSQHSHPSGREYFQAQLDLATLAAEAGHLRLAKGLFVALDRCIQDNHLEAWEPQLAEECLVGLLSCLKRLIPSGNSLASEGAVYYDRLCGINPEAAQRMATPST